MKPLLVDVMTRMTASCREIPKLTTSMQPKCFFFDQRGNDHINYSLMQRVVNLGILYALAHFQPHLFFTNFNTYTSPTSTGTSISGPTVAGETFVSNVSPYISIGAMGNQSYQQGSARSRSRTSTRTRRWPVRSYCSPP